MFNNFFFRKSCLLGDNVGKKIIVERGKATYDNMAHAHWMLDNYDYKHTLTICNTYSLPPNNNGCMNASQLYIRPHISNLSFCSNIFSAKHWTVHSIYFTEEALKPIQIFLPIVWRSNIFAISIRKRIEKYFVIHEAEERTTRLNVM